MSCAVIWRRVSATMSNLSRSGEIGHREHLLRTLFFLWSVASLVFSPVYSSLSCVHLFLHPPLHLGAYCGADWYIWLVCLLWLYVNFLRGMPQKSSDSFLMPSGTQLFVFLKSKKVWGFFNKLSSKKNKYFTVISYWNSIFWGCMWQWAKQGLREVCFWWQAQFELIDFQPYLPSQIIVASY